MGEHVGHGDMEKMENIRRLKTLIMIQNTLLLIQGIVFMIQNTLLSSTWLKTLYLLHLLRRLKHDNIHAWRSWSGVSVKRLVETWKWVILSIITSSGCWTPNSACHQTKLLLGSSDLVPPQSFEDNVIVIMMLMSRVPILKSGLIIDNYEFKIKGARPPLLHTCQPLSRCLYTQGQSWV